MKTRKFWLKPTLFSMLLSGCVVCACGDDDPEPPSSTDPVIPEMPENPDTEGAMSPTQQKQRMEDVALALMETMPASDFQSLYDLSEYISETYFDDYDWDNVGEWADDILESLRKATGTHTDTERSPYGSVYNYIYNDYKAVILASNFKGHFTARNGRWTKSEASDLQFIFNDQNGQQCVLKLATSGQVKKVHMFNLEDWYDYDYSKDSKGNYIYNDYFDYTEYTVGVPESIVVTLTRDGKDVIKTTVNINLASISGEEFDLSRNSLTASTKVELENGYVINAKNISYTGNQKASAACVISKQGKDLITMAMASDLSGIPDCNVSAFTQTDFDWDDLDKDNANATNAVVKVDVMGRIQCQGLIKDVRQYAEHLADAEDNDDNESLFKSYINMANSLADIRVFYDNTQTVHATIHFEPFMEEEYYGYTYWTSEPVLKFYDGSSYSTFSAFFNEKSFRKVVDAFEDLVDDYSNMAE